MTGSNSVDVYDIGFRGRTKHVYIKLKCSRECVQDGWIGLEFEQSKGQLADILTKRLRRPLLLSKKCPIWPLREECDLSNGMLQLKELEGSVQE